MKCSFICLVDNFRLKKRGVSVAYVLKLVAIWLRCDRQRNEECFCDETLAVYMESLHVNYVIHFISVPSALHDKI
jgi:hypothetical protein